MRCFRQVSSLAALVAAVTLGGATAALAQAQAELEGTQIAGWTFTPGVIASAVFDDNVGLAATFPTRPDTRGDQLFVIEPFGQFEFNGPRTTFESSYRGYLRHYADLDELDGYDQRAYASLRHRQTRRVTLFMTETLMKVPSTDELELDGVAFSRTGSRNNTLAAGIESRLTRHMDLNVRYDFTWVDFDANDAITGLRDGFINGARAQLARHLNDRSALGVEYGVRFAELDHGTRNLTFQDVGATFNYTTGPHTSVDTAAGISHLTDRNHTISRTGPYVRAGIAHHMERATVGASFSRAFVPTFGFGGAGRSVAFHAYIRMPIRRNRLYVQQSVSWRRTDPLVATVFPLDSWWLHSTAGYGLSRWMRVEGFYSYSRQDSKVAGGLVNRQRVGAQIVLAQPMRLQ
jgi:hypothetical protein